MAVLPIIKLGHPALRKEASEISDITEDIRELAANMIDTMQLHEGIGLAGPQVNVLKRIFVIDLEIIDETLAPKAYINPKILSVDGSDIMDEGCLSIPDVRADVERPFKLEVEYQTLEGETVREEVEELTARVFQHELDHLDGVLFIDKISTFKRKLLEPQLKKIREAHSIL
jgi:peptide deformylase